MFRVLHPSPLRLHSSLHRQENNINQIIDKLTDLGFEFGALDHNGIPIDEVDTELTLPRINLSKLQSTKKNPKRKGTPKSGFKEGKWLVLGHIFIQRNRDRSTSTSKSSEKKNITFVSDFYEQSNHAIQSRIQMMLFPQGTRKMVDKLPDTNRTCMKIMSLLFSIYVTTIVTLA